MGKIVAAVVVIGIVIGSMAYFGDGAMPWEGGWFDSATAKIKSISGYGEETINDKLPDPQELGVPQMDEAKPQPEFAPPDQSEGNGFSVPNPNQEGGGF